MGNDKNLMIRLKSKDKEYLQQLATKKNESMTKVIEGLLEEHRRRNFFEALSAEYADLRKNEQEWKDELNEQRTWDNTSADGLENE